MDTTRPVFQPPVHLAQLQAGQTILDGLRSLGPTLPALMESRRLIGVFDADLLLRDLKYTMTHGYLSALALTMRTGLLRSFAAMAVWDEVMEKIERQAFEFRWEPPHARMTWLTDYAPWIDFIDTSGLPQSDARTIESARRDPDDVPTAQLVVLLTPDIFFSCNRRHYPGLRALNEKWARVTRACRDQSVREVVLLESTLAGSMVCTLALTGAHGVVHGLARLDRRIFVGLGLLAMFAFLHPTTRRILLARASEVGVALRSGLQTGLRTWTEHMAEWETLARAAQLELAEYRRTGERPPHVRERAATVLARANTALSLPELQTHMMPWGPTPARPNDTSYLRRVLRAHPQLFRETDRGRWFLVVRRLRPAATAS
jgi:hypothetical protein